MCVCIAVRVRVCFVINARFLAACYVLFVRTKFATRVAHCVWICACFLSAPQLLTAKEVVYLVNLSKRDYLRKANKWLPKIQAKVEELGGGQMIPFSVEFEQEVCVCTRARVRPCT